MPPLNSKDKPPDKKRVRAQITGRMAEHFAALFLRLKLYSILARRVKTPVGEIDLIAKRGNWVVFVEVKMRRTRTAQADALAKVNKRRIINAAQFYLSGNPEIAQKNLRFDVIFLAPYTWPTHLQAAFEQIR